LFEDTIYRSEDGGSFWTAYELWEGGGNQQPSDFLRVAIRLSFRCWGEKRRDGDTEIGHFGLSNASERKLPQFLPPLTRETTRVMIFVDGENLAIRYKAELADRKPVSHVVHVTDTMVWSNYASRQNGPQEFVRRYYYTSARGDEDARDQLEIQLKDLGIEAPRVFPRKKTGRSKRVDITLATEMLTHAHRGNYDIAVLVAGDEDYVPLIEAVKQEGKRVAVWALESGLSPAIKKAADHYWNIGELLFRERKTDGFDAIWG
jgi:uncharacterized LabA/DUF88 family protein